MATRQRDTQRSRLYAAEIEAAAQFGETIPCKGTHPSIAEVQTWLDDTVLSQRWFQSRWGNRRVEVRFKAYGSATGYTQGHMCLPPWAREPRVVLHELAHVLDPGGAAHGPQFAATMMTLVRLRLGADAATALRAAYGKRRVRYREGMAAVPKAGTRRVVTKTARRAAAAERDNRPVTAEEKAAAADVLRRAARQGLFGASGRKPREHALATARWLQ